MGFLTFAADFPFFPKSNNFLIFFSFLKFCQPHGPFHLLPYLFSPFSFLFPDPFRNIIKIKEATRAASSEKECSRLSDSRGQATASKQAKKNNGGLR